MEFTWPFLLVLLSIVPILLFVYWRIQRKRVQAAVQFTRLGFGRQNPGWRRHAAPLLILLGVTGLLLTAARPHTIVSQPRLEGTIILAFDVSGSMSADDLKPTRMEAAKAAVSEFVERQPAGILIGVVAFSDSGLSVQRPTNDKAEIQAAIARLTPQRGTSLGSGIIASLNTISSGNATNWVQPNVYSNLTPEPTATPTPMPPGVYAPAVIILLSDGDNNANPDPVLAALGSQEKGVRIYTVGIGSEEGATIQVNGFTVHTQLNAELLQSLAKITGGEYFNAQSEEELKAIYDSIDLQWVVKPEKTEVTALFAAASLLVFLLAGWLSLIWFGRVP